MDKSSPKNLETSINWPLQLSNILPFPYTEFPQIVKPITAPFKSHWLEGSEGRMPQFEKGHSNGINHPLNF